MCEMPSVSLHELAVVVQNVAQELVGSQISVDTPLMEAGLDSLGAVEFRSRLASQLGDVKLSETLIFDFPTLRQVEMHLSSHLSSSSQIQPVQPQAGGAGGMQALLPFLA